MSLIIDVLIKVIYRFYNFVFSIKLSIACISDPSSGKRSSSAKKTGDAFLRIAGWDARRWLSGATARLKSPADFGSTCPEPASRLSSSECCPIISIEFYFWKFQNGKSHYPRLQHKVLQAAPKGTVCYPQFPF